MARKIKFRHDLVYVEWVDSSSYRYQGWHSIEDHENAASMIGTCGFLIYEDDDKITLGLSVSENDNVCGDMTIPKVAITFRKKLSA